MCGRFSLGLPHEVILELNGYNLNTGEWVHQDRFQPRHNIAPRSQAPVIRRRGEGSGAAEPSEADTRLVLHTMKWGLVPHWSKHEDLTMNTINARSENLIEGTGMWKSLRSWKRCAIPCEGYFEWLKKGKDRLPHFTKRQDGKLLLLAGLYDSVLLEGQTETLYSFTIVTTSANKEFEWLHERQPVMLPTTEALNTWLDTTNHKWDSEIISLMDPHHDIDAPLQCYQVPKEVGKIGTESPTFIEPITARKDGIQAMFARQTAKAPTSPSSSRATAEPQTPQKRKRSSSPKASSSTPHRSPTTPKRVKHEVIDLLDDELEDEKPKKTEKVDTLEDDGIEYADAPKAKKKIAPGSPGRKSKKEMTKHPSTPKKAKKSSKPANDAGSPKITQFFKPSK